MASAMSDLHSVDNVDSTCTSTNATTTLPKSSSSRRFDQLALAVAKKAQSAIGLPGLSEVGEMIGQLAETTDRSQAELMDLSTHLEALLRIMDEPSSPPDQPTDLSSENEDIRRQFDVMLCNSRSLNASSARKREEDLERLSKKSERLAEQQIIRYLRMQQHATQALHHRINSQFQSLTDVAPEVRDIISHAKRPPSPEVDQLFEDKLAEVDLGLIANQQVECSYTAVDEHNIFGFRPAICESGLTASNDGVYVTCTTGILNGVKVMRKSYNASKAGEAVKLATRDIMSLSKYSHPNVALLRGVKRDTNGQIREIIVTTAPMTQAVFLKSVTDPAAIACFLKGITELMRLEKMSGRHSRWMKGGVQIQVDFHGHVTAIPAANMSQSYIWRIGSLLYSVDWMRASSQPSKDILKAYENGYLYGWDKQSLLQFIDGISCLKPSFTSLDVMRVARDARLTPRQETLTSHSHRAPDPVTVRQIGVWDKGSLKGKSKREFWTTPSALYLSQINSSGVPGFDFKILPTADGCAELDSDTRHIIWKDRDKIDYKVLRLKAEQLSQSRGVAFHELCIVAQVTCMSTIRHTKRLCRASRLGINPDYRMPLLDSEELYCDGLGCPPGVADLPRLIYFHRRPASNSPREFWGFFSTLCDPRASCPEFLPDTSKFNYFVQYQVHMMKDDYGYRYDKMIVDGLGLIPGSWRNGN